MQAPVLMLLSPVSPTAQGIIQSSGIVDPQSLGLSHVSAHFVLYRLQIPLLYNSKHLSSPIFAKGIKLPTSQAGCPTLSLPHPSFPWVIPLISPLL